MNGRSGAEEMGRKTLVTFLFIIVIFLLSVASIPPKVERRGKGERVGPAFNAYPLAK